MYHFRSRPTPRGISIPSGQRPRNIRLHPQTSNTAVEWVFTIILEDVAYRGSSIVALPDMFCSPNWGGEIAYQKWGGVVCERWLDRLKPDLIGKGINCTLLRYDYLSQEERRILADDALEPAKDIPIAENMSAKSEGTAEEGTVAEGGLAGEESVSRTDKAALEEKLSALDISGWATRLVGYLSNRNEREKVGMQYNSLSHAYSFQGNSLIFICFGLGGLIFKKAFLDFYNECNECIGLTTFVVFVGTPHRGLIANTSNLEVAKMWKKMQEQVHFPSPFSEFLDIKFRIVSMDIPIRCYSLGNEDRYGPFSRNQEGLARHPRPAMGPHEFQLSQYAQWNGFDDHFEPFLPDGAHNYDMRFGDGGDDKYYRSLYERIHALVQSSEQQRPIDKHTIREEILRQVDVHHHFLTPDDLVSTSTGTLSNGAETPGSPISNQPLPTFALSLFHILEKAVATDPEFKEIDFQSQGSFNENGEIIVPGEESLSRIEWLHVEHCVGNWALVLLAAIAIRKRQPLISRENLTGDLWKGFLQKIHQERPDWQYPTPSFQTIPQFQGPANHSSSLGAQIGQTVLFFPYL